ncbi:MAG: hypothetical protein AAF501_08010 [Pseudomonadota bacterium]
MRRILCSLVLALGVALPAQADEIGDTIRAALEAYEGGDVSLAKEELDYANQLLGQLKAEGLTDFLPEALPGWTRGEAETQAIGAAAFGGGLTAEASYTGGSGSITLRLMADNPMVAAMSTALGNAAIMGSMGTVKRINRQKLVVTPQGEIQALVDNKVLIQIDGSGSVEDKLSYFERLDIRGLKAF